MSSALPTWLRSLGLRTDLMLHALTSEVVPGDEFIAVRTPSNPAFRWGNYLVFRRPPAVGDLDRWREIFHAEIGGPPTLTHVAVTWDAPDGTLGEIQPLLDAGFEREDVVVMTTHAISDLAGVNTDCVVGEFTTSQDWDDWCELAIAQNTALPDDEREGDGHDEYVFRRSRELADKVESGAGRWYGARIRGQLVASAGLFVGDGLGRFQVVDTHPEFRRQGLARTVIMHAARDGFGEMGAETLVIAADDAYFAKSLYGALGFTATEHLVELTWMAPHPI